MSEVAFSLAAVVKAAILGSLVGSIAMAVGLYLAGRLK